MAYYPLEPACKDAYALVVGSSPNINLDALRSEQEKCGVRLSANGAIGIEYAADVHQVLCTTGYLWRSGMAAVDMTDAEFQNQQACICHHQAMWFDAQHLQKMPPSICTLPTLNTHIVMAATREAMIAATIGHPLRVSTGLWAICIALLSGARHVSIHGIHSHATAGHYGSEHTSPRDHVVEDREALAIIKEQYADRVEVW